MNKTLISIAILSTFLVACGSSEKKAIVKQYFDAMQASDVEVLKTILKKPKNADMFAADSGFSMTAKNIEILEEVATGVNVKYTRFCYADIIVPTIVVDTDDGLKVDLMATMKGEFNAMKNSKPLKQYCYDFEDKPLSGTINKKPWTFVKSHSRDINWGTKVTTSTSLYAEDCDTELSGGCTLPSLIISNLDLTGSGGNLGAKENITIHTPPGDNEVISQGSYRVTPIENNKVKLELTFQNDDGNTVSGFILIDQKS